MYILPIVTLQYTMGVLVQLKHTALFRVALLPIVLWTILRTLSTLDLSCGKQDQTPKNVVLFVSCIFASRENGNVNTLILRPP